MKAMHIVAGAGLLAALEYHYLSTLFLAGGLFGNVAYTVFGAWTTRKQ